MPILTALRNLQLQVNLNKIAAGLPMMPESPYKCSYWGCLYRPGEWRMDNLRSLVYSPRVVMGEFSVMSDPSLGPHSPRRHDAKS